MVFRLFVFAVIGCAVCASGLRAGVPFVSEGFRTPRPAATNFVAGVPLYNSRSLQFVSRWALKRWVVALNQDAFAPGALREVCVGARFVYTGQLRKTGLSFMMIQANKSELTNLVRRFASSIDFVEPDVPTRLIPTGLRVRFRQIKSRMSGSGQRAGFAPLLWNLPRVGRRDTLVEGRGVHVYVLDTGIRTTHVEFEGRAVPTFDATTSRQDGNTLVPSPTECNGSPTCALDTEGHGTHCASTAGGANFGIAPKAIVRAVKIMGLGGQGQLSWQLFGLDYVSDKGERPAVVSMSVSVGKKGVWVSIGAAVETAVSAGIVVVVAAGNENDDACKYSPSFSPFAITVGASDYENARPQFSNYGSCVTVFAPGDQFILGASGHSDTNDGFFAPTLDGTEVACSHVSGAAALVLERFPDYRPMDVRKELERRALKGALTNLGPADSNLLLFVGDSNDPLTVSEEARVSDSWHSQLAAAPAPKPIMLGNVSADQL